MLARVAQDYLITQPLCALVHRAQAQAGRSQARLLIPVLLHYFGDEPPCRSSNPSHSTIQIKRPPPFTIRHTLTQLKQFTSLTGKFREAQAQKRESNQRRQPAKRL
jgi:hypothetical protein